MATHPLAEAALRPIGDAATSPNAIRAWKPALPGVREVLHARFHDHDYPRHTHDDWTVFIVDDGVIHYGLDRHERVATGSMVGLLPPNVVHDGRVGAADGYRKRVLYVDTDVLPESLVGAAVDRSSIDDAEFVGEIAAIHDALACPEDALEAETRFALATERIRSWLGRPDPPPPPGSNRVVAEAVRAVLDARLVEPLTLAEVAAQAGWSPAHAARAFSEVFGISPHAYLLGRRLDAARDRILAGQPLADVAVATGFFDQPHLTRHFRRFLGATPAGFRSGVRMAT
ncbi:MAG: AraC family transcriptional regulator [Chloroflexota bacterium]